MISAEAVLFKTTSLYKMLKQSIIIYLWWQSLCSYHKQSSLIIYLKFIDFFPLENCAPIMNSLFTYRHQYTCAHHQRFFFIFFPPFSLKIHSLQQFEFLICVSVCVCGMILAKIHLRDVIIMHRTTKQTTLFQFN